MKLRQYKKLVVKTIKQANDDDLLVIRFDMDKIKPDILYAFMKSIWHKVKCIAIPIDVDIDRLDTRQLELIRDIIDKEIESRR